MAIARLLAPTLGALLFAVGPVAGADSIFVRADDAFVLSNVPDDDSYRLLLRGAEDASLAAAGPSAEGRWQDMLLVRARQYHQWVDEAARQTGVEAQLLHAVIAAESGYNPAARSAKGAIGIMQLIPATARRYGVADAYDGRQNILGGARYLADLLRRFGNDKVIAIAAYNAGEQAVARNGGRIPPYRETVSYVPRVMAFYRLFSSRAL
jgi:soluble lytic murein transglycosylase-like protein